MKRKGNLYAEICSKENLILADKKARKGKRNQVGVLDFDKNKDINLLRLREILVNKTYKTSKYTTFFIYEPKAREIFRLPYFPDRITHHAVMNVLEKIFVSTFTADTFSCIKKRGIHGALRAVNKSLKDEEGTKYCLKLDIQKFYPSVDHDILKKLLRRKIKDRDLLWLLDGIIDSAKGLPIGNYLSQYFANFYLTYFDHYVKEVLGVKYYFRYADDIVVLSASKIHLHQVLQHIKTYLSVELKLTVKNNYQIFPVASRGIDFVGYKSYHRYILLRKRIKKNFARKVAVGCNEKSFASYNGWLNHSNGVNLRRKMLNGRNKKIFRFQDRKTIRKQVGWRKNKNSQVVRERDSNILV